jgi:hypothetical protein
VKSILADFSVHASGGWERKKLPAIAARLAPVQHERVARDERRVVARQEREGACDVLGCAESALGDQTVPAKEKREREERARGGGDDGLVV